MAASLTPGGSGDIFLAVQTKRAGKVKGEAASPGHEGEIVAQGWQWGVTANVALGSTQATSRRTYRFLVVHKRIDSATTALLSALATNDEVKEARLTMRRAGGEQADYFSIVLKQARIADLVHQASADGDTVESVSIAFGEVEVEYRPQLRSGGAGGATTFSDVLVPS
jgi:type VI secretion system secreted protein Hcp